MRYRRFVAALLSAASILALPAAAQAAFGDRTLRRGMHGHDVRVLQSWLTRLGQPTVIDGAFGRATRRSVRRYERAHDLKVDGVVTRLEARGMRTRIAVPDPARAAISADGRSALAPAGAPPQVQAMIAAANRITSTSYRYGGGHRRFQDSAYDCSGAVSYALHGAGLLDAPEDSRRLERYGRPGRGDWVTVYANGGHAYLVIAGARFDTSGRGERGPRWRREPRSGRGYVVRHPAGL
jgi:peptidoglycan hydrolase-like protein with peptidoglycan-binding domain